MPLSCGSMVPGIFIVLVGGGHYRSGKNTAQKVHSGLYSLYLLPPVVFVLRSRTRSCLTASGAV